MLVKPVILSLNINAIMHQIDVHAAAPFRRALSSHSAWGFVVLRPFSLSRAVHDHSTSAFIKTPPDRLQEEIY